MTEGDPRAAAAPFTDAARARLVAAYEACEPADLARAAVAFGEHELNPDGAVGGPALKAGVDAEHQIKVRQLPDAEEIAFKTVETYSAGKMSRWIELPSGGDEPEQPAPSFS
jgi:hypothetical protein